MKAFSFVPCAGTHPPPRCQVAPIAWARSTVSYRAFAEDRRYAEKIYISHARPPIPTPTTADAAPIEMFILPAVSPAGASASGVLTR